MPRRLAIERAQRREHIVDRDWIARIGRLAQGRFAFHRKPVGRPGGEDGALDLWLHGGVPCNVERMKKSGDRLRYDAPPFACRSFFNWPIGRPQIWEKIATRQESLRMSRRVETAFWHCVPIHAKT